MPGPKNPRPDRAHERGAALLFALVVMMVLVVLATDIGIRTGLAFDRSRRALRMVESRSLQKKVEKNLFGLNRETVTALSEEPREFDVHDFRIQMTFEPTESKININRLDDLVLGGSVKKLFAALLKRERLENRAFPCAMDWIDPDDDPRPTGAEDSDYSGEDVVPRNAPFETVDELTLVRGFRDPSAFDRLRPFLTAFGSGKIYIPAVSDQLLDLFEDVYGVPVRNSLEDMRRNPGRQLSLPSGAVSAVELQALQELLTNVPASWQVTVILTGRHFYSRATYVLTFGDDPAKPQSLLRIS